MAGVLDGLMQHLDAGTLKQMSGELGTDEATTRSAVSTALPLLVASLANNSSTPAGANALAGALDRDHDGSMLGNLAGMLGGGAGASILGHVLGGSQPQVTNSLGKATGLDAGRAGKLLMMLAPLVLAYLGKQKREQGLDADGVGGMLGQEREQIQRTNPGVGGLLGMLDRDKDGSVVDDVGGMVGKMFGR